MHVHCSMTLAPGQAEDDVSEMLVRSLPLIKKLGWTLAGSYRVLNGPTRTILNFWDIPDANAFMALPGQLAADPELCKIMVGLEEAMIHNELTLLSQKKIPATPANADTKAPDEKTVYLRETVTALSGKGGAATELVKKSVPLLEKRGFRLLGSWGRATGATGMLMNLWQLPASAKSLAIHDLVAADAEVARALAAIADISSSIELTYLRKMPYSPGAFGASQLPR